MDIMERLQREISREAHHEAAREILKLRCCLAKIDHACRKRLLERPGEFEQWVQAEVTKALGPLVTYYQRRPRGPSPPRPS